MGSRSCRSQRRRGGLCVRLRRLEGITASITTYQIELGWGGPVVEDFFTPYEFPENFPRTQCLSVRTEH